MKIDEVESTTKKARVATHTHIKVIFYFFVLVLFFFVSLSRINNAHQSCWVDDAVNRHRGRFLFLSRSRSRVLFSLSPRDETCLRETHDRVSG